MTETYRPVTTSIAVLGTLADIHREPIPYDLGALVALVRQIQPDLLCLDLTPEQWRDQAFADLPPEYREALLPLARLGDMVVVPIAGDCPPPEPSVMGWRAGILRWAIGGLAALHRSAPDPTSANQGWRHDLANLLYAVIGRLAGPGLRQEWRNHIVHLTQQVLTTARRDPGCRILVAVNVRYCHHIRHALQGQPAVRVVSFSEL